MKTKVVSAYKKSQGKHVIANKEKYIFSYKRESQDEDFQIVSTDSQKMCDGGSSTVNVS